MTLKFFRVVAVVAFALTLPSLSLPASEAQEKKAAETAEEATQLIEANEYKAAFPLFQKAAKQGNPEAMVGLAFFYEIGCVVPQDFGEAEKWYRQAAKLGSAEAKETLEMYKDQTGLLMRGFIVALIQENMSC